MINPHETECAQGVVLLAGQLSALLDADSPLPSAETYRRAQEMMLEMRLCLDRAEALGGVRERRRRDLEMGPHG